MKLADPFKDSADSRLIIEAAPSHRREVMRHAPALLSQIEEALGMTSLKLALAKALLASAYELICVLLGDYAVKRKKESVQVTDAGRDRDDPIIVSAANGRR